MGSRSDHDRILKALLILLILIALVTVGMLTYVVSGPVRELVENGRPKPTFVPTMRPTKTPKPTKTPEPTVMGTADPTRDPGSTSEPTMTPTQEPGSTAEPTLPPTPGPSPTAAPTMLPTPPVSEHDVNVWHEAMLWHDHGANPADAHPLLRPVVEKWGIASTWSSSPMENAFPGGMHAAFTNLSETDTGCEQFLLADEGYNCVNAFFLQLHAGGTTMHGRTDVHSYRAAVLVCGTAAIDEATCGYVVTGGWHDYLLTHAPYKKHFCADSDGNPDPVIPETYKFNTPYVALAVQTDGEHVSDHRIFWNSLGPGAVLVDETLAQRGYIPNRGLQLAWSEVDAWAENPGYEACTDPAQDKQLCPDGSTDATCSLNGNEFQVFTIRWFNGLPSERPFSGWTDRHGNVVAGQESGGCTQEGLDCVPLIISENVPQGAFLLNRTANLFETNAPLLQYGTDEPMRMPPFSLDD